VSAANGLKALWLSWFSKPAADRFLYRAIRKRRPRQILLLGLDNIPRALQIISLAQRYHRAEQIHFVGIDQFEARPDDQPRLTLKQAHRLLRPSGARINLIPGDPYEALSRTANSLLGTELVIISANQNLPARSPAWFYLPRTLTANALVLREEPSADGPLLKPVNRVELQHLAHESAPRRRAA
jgi:hypothetical protein